MLKTTNASAGELTDSQTEQIHLLRESRIHCEFQELLSRRGVQTVFKSSHENMFELHRPLDPESTWNDICSQKHICRTDPQRNTVNPGSTFSSCFSREWLIIVQSGCCSVLIRFGVRFLLENFLCWELDRALFTRYLSIFRFSDNNASVLLTKHRRVPKYTSQNSSSH